MPQQPIPFVPNQASGNEELAGASPLAVNVVVDASGAVRRRPGVVAYSSGPAVVDADGVFGLHATVTGRVYAVGGTELQRSIYRLANGIPAELSNGATGYLKGTSRPVFAETEAMVVLAGGSDIQRVYFADNTSDRLSGDAPLATHVIANNSRLLANNATTDRGRVNYSDNAAGSSTTGHETWTVADDQGGFFEAEARPDPCVALHENTNEVFVFGPTSVQVYAPDSNFVYSPVSTREYGLISPYCVVKVDGQFFWLDHLRRIVRSDGRSFEVISDNIKRTLDTVAVVSDAFAYRVVVGSVDAVCFCFPTDGRTFVYQVGAGWALWMGWSVDANNFARLAVNVACLDPVTGTTLVGLTTGEVGTLSVDAYTDLGSEINASVTTGYLSRGTDARKHCRVVRLAFRRGETLTATEPVALLSWRDDGGAWGDPMEVGLGASGDVDPVIELRSLGTYRRREWRLEFSGAEDVVLVSATEEFDFLAG